MTSRPVASRRIASHHILSHPIPFHPIPSHPIPSHPIPSHPIPSHPVPSRHVTSHHIASHRIASRTPLHRIASHHITSHHITSHPRHITSIHITSRRGETHRIISHRITLHRIASHRIASHRTWLLRRPFSFLPPVTYPDQCQLSPTALSDWLQDRASIPARTGYEARSGANYTSRSGLPLDWFHSDQQRHITAHRMDNIPTMTILAHRSSHRNTVPDTMCLLCGAQPETAPHLWACSGQSHEWGLARRRLAEWLDQKVGKRAVSVHHQL